MDSKRPHGQTEGTYYETRCSKRFATRHHFILERRRCKPFVSLAVRLAESGTNLSRHHLMLTTRFALLRSDLSRADLDDQMSGWDIYNSAHTTRAYSSIFDHCRFAFADKPCAGGAQTRSSTATSACLSVAAGTINSMATTVRRRRPACMLITVE